MPAAEADPQAAASLTSFYGGLPALDAKVGEAAQEFNGLYLSGSPEERRAGRGGCEEGRAPHAPATAPPASGTSVSLPSRERGFT